MDLIIYELFGNVTEPIELVVRFFIVILMMEGLFGVVGVLFKPLISKG